MIFDHREGRGDKKDLGIQNNPEDQGGWELELDHITGKPDTVHPFFRLWMFVPETLQKTNEQYSIEAH